MPKPTASYTECWDQKNREEKAIRFTQLLNSANVRRPVGDIRAHFRNMKNHDPVMVKNMIQGDYAKSPKYILNAKSAMVSFASWWAHDKDSLKKRQMSKNWRMGRTPLVKPRQTAAQSVLTLRVLSSR